MITKNIEDLDLETLIKILIKNKILIIFTTLAFSLTSILISLSIPNKYTSSSVLISSNNSDSSNTSSMLSKYGGLASMAGVQIPSSAGEDRGELALQVVRSKSFFKHLIEIDPSILQNIFAANGYDFNSLKIEYDNKVFKDGKWVRKVNGIQKSKPSYVEAYLDYQKVLSITKDKRTGYITINAVHYSPDFSKKLIETVIFEANKIIRERDLLNSNSSLDYLNEELKKTQQSSIKQSINDIIKNQLEIKMMAFLRDDYLLTVIDEPFIPELKSSPSRSIIVIFSTILGFIISMFAAIFKSIK